MTLKKIQIVLIILAAFSTLGLFFIVKFLVWVYLAEHDEASVEGFRIYRSRIVPIRDAYFYATAGLCIFAILATYKRYKRIGYFLRWELIVCILLSIVVAGAFFIKGFLPHGRLI